MLHPPVLSQVAGEGVWSSLWSTNTKNVMLRLYWGCYCPNIHTRFSTRHMNKEARESFVNGLIQFGWQPAGLLEYKGRSSMYHSARFIVQPQLQVLPKVRINIITQQLQLFKHRNVLSMPNATNIQTTFSYFNKTRYVHPKQIHLTCEQNIIQLEVTYHQVPIVFFFLM